jgi:hypothetical protein
MTIPSYCFVELIVSGASRQAPMILFHPIRHCGWMSVRDRLTMASVLIGWAFNNGRGSVTFHVTFSSGDRTVKH